MAGLTEGLRDELGDRAGITVCGAYPAFADTPTRRRSASYTGRTLHAVLAAPDSQRVADAVIELAGLALAVLGARRRMPLWGSV